LGAAMHLNAKYIGLIGVMTAVQVLMQVFIFATELHSLTNDISWGQILSYTGVANLSLFVAITPGGIGIREAFLLFSTQLHHISSSTIVSASVIDRGVYLVFLGVLFVLVITMHAKDKLQVTKSL
ncbi:MAG TPA: lysylphosphatidylglycerol synthase domain-containing protein, partial [Candidatus Saccharimonadales bacterium]|nr:lysylphosphatidylglycerol synthase domain-containing protein [Candidatus Saccharimonadales bacterium]